MEDDDYIIILIIPCLYYYYFTSAFDEGGIYIVGVTVQGLYLSGDYIIEMAKYCTDHSHSHLHPPPHNAMMG